ncbi:MAG: inosine-uridine nucleoside N-ribohydrolase [Myxococcota bacterium]|jgi:inosine-uridine nucleoside N-ribohydrolase
MAIDIVWDMETGDPDDFLTLLFLAGHPDVTLRAVTVTPGGADQIAVVRWALAALELPDVVVGGFTPPREQEELDRERKGQVLDRVSGWHWRAYDIPKVRDYDVLPGWEVLRDHLGEGVTLVTGGPLKNIGALLSEPGDAPLGRLFAQGGFAGDNIVPPQRRLAKFDGMLTCPTFNLNGAPQAALAAAVSPRFSQRRFISKNVCHGVYYDPQLHQTVAAAIAVMPESRHRRSLSLIWQGMAEYLRRKSGGKKFHDPLAAACALDPGLAEWAEVELYRERGKWGAKAAPGSGTWIITGYRRERFIEVLLGAGR